MGKERAKGAFAQSWVRPAPSGRFGYVSSGTGQTEVDHHDIHLFKYTDQVSHSDVPFVLPSSTTMIAVAQRVFRQELTTRGRLFSG